MECEVDQHARTWGMVCHLAALAGYIGIPFGHVVGPLIVWLIKKDESPFIDAQGRLAVNYQITLTIYGAVLFVIGLILGVVTCGFGWALLWIAMSAWAVADIVFAVLGGLRANEGGFYPYPYLIEFIH